MYTVFNFPISVAARSKAWVCVRRFLGFRVRSRGGHGCLSVVSFVCCLVELFAIGKTCVHRSSVECLCVLVYATIILYT
jgi:hypothetical protein